MEVVIAWSLNERTIVFTQLANGVWNFLVSPEDVVFGYFSHFPLFETILNFNEQVGSYRDENDCRNDND